MPFVIIPANQAAKPTKKSSTGSTKKGRPLNSSPKQTSAIKRGTVSGASRTTVNVAAYGGKLFEPIMAREKPIFVHFKDFIIRDDESITRFSEDGWFSIKFFLEKDNEGRSRCYLVYFLNPIDADKNYNLMRACQEAIEYKVYEFYDKPEYVLAAKRKDREGLSPQDAVKLRLSSALGQAEQMIIQVLREKITAEKFLKRQEEYTKQEKAWQMELDRLNKLEEEETEDESNTTLGNDDEQSVLSTEDVDASIEEEENQEASEQERQEGTEVKLQEQEVSPRAEPEVKPQPKQFVWGGGKK